MTLPDAPKAGEVWLAYLRFSDKPSIGKVRPVLILGSRGDAFAICVTCLKITSRTADDGRRDVAVKEWRSCGLRKPSYIRLDQIFELGRSGFLADGKLGDLDENEFESVLEELEKASA
jgi:mRNA interferase MazF